MPAELSAELNTCFTADIPHPVAMVTILKILWHGAVSK